MDEDSHCNSSAGATSLTATRQPSISRDISLDALDFVERFFRDIRYSSAIPPNFTYKDSYSDLFRNHIQVRSVERGKISCLLTVKLPIMAKIVIDGTVVRRGRNLTVVAVEFKLEESSKLVYTSRATFYNMPAASL